VLGDRGLVDALRAAALSAPVQCSVGADGIGRYPPEIENAVYNACVGALGSVGSEATRIAISLWTDERLRFAVSNNGARAPDSDPGQDGWLTEARDRLAAVGGALAVESAPSDGTRVVGDVPLR
jgi:signal transduction histidine kinase